MASWEAFPVVKNTSNPSDSWDSFPKVEEEPMIDVSDTLKAAGQAIGGITTTAPHAFRQLYSGLDNPWQRSEGYKASQESQDKYQQELEAANRAAVESGDISTASRGMRQAGQSLGFSAGAMGASLAGGSAAGTAGRYIGGLAGPEGAIAGEAGGRVIGALGASYGAAYRMAGAQFLDDASKEIDAKFMEKIGRLPNEQEQKEAYDELLPLAQAFGHAEAGPEAIGNLAMAKAGKFILGLGIKNIKGLAAGALAKVGAGAGALATELGGETVTQVEQKRIDAQKDALLSGQAPPEQGTRTLGEYKTALGEIAPATIATMGLIGSVPTAYKAGQLTVNAFKKPEIAAAADLVHSAATTSEETPLTTAAAEQAVQSAATATVRGLGEEAEAFNETLRKTQEESAAADSQAAQMRAQKETAAAQEAASRQAQYETLRNEQPITSAAGNLVPQDGTEQDAAIESEQTLPDSGGILEEAQPQAVGQEPQESLVGEPETAPRITELARQAAAINAGQERGANLGFPQVQPTAVEQPAERRYTVANVKTGKVVSRPDEPMTHKEAVTFRSKFSQPNNFTLVDVTNEQVSPQEAAPTGIATMGQPISGDSGIARDVTKPEQQGPNEFTPVGNPAYQGNFKSKKNAEVRLAELTESISKSPEMRAVLSRFGLKDNDAYLVAKSKQGKWSIGPTHQHRIALALFKQQPVSSAAVDSYGIKLPEGYQRQGELYVYSPLSPAPTQETPSSPAAKLEKEGVVPGTSAETEDGGRSIAPVATKETPQGEVSSGKVEAGNAALDGIISQLPQVAQAKYTPEVRAKAAKFFESQDGKDLEGLTAIQKTKIREANYLSNKQAAEQEKNERKLYEKKLREEEKENARLEKEREKQAKLTESRREAYDSVIGTAQNIVMGAVSAADGQEALQLVHNSGDVPGALGAFVGTSKQFLDNPENEKIGVPDRPMQTGDFVFRDTSRGKITKELPDGSYEVKFDGKEESELVPASQLEWYSVYNQVKKTVENGVVDEGSFNGGRAFVFTDGIGINSSDIEAGKKLGLPPSVAAVRRVLLHESLVHRGIYGLPQKYQNAILQWVRQNASTENLDILAKDYPQYADWATNPQSELGLCEEYLARKVEKITVFPKDGPLARLFDILRDIWRYVTGRSGEPTVQNLRDIVKLLKAGAANADARLVNGGKVDIASHQYTFKTNGNRTTISLNGEKIQGPTSSNLNDFPDARNTANEEEAYFSSRESNDRVAASETLGKPVEATRRIERVTIPNTLKGTGLGKALVLAHLQQFPNVTFYNSQASPELTRAFQALARDGYIDLNGEMAIGRPSLANHTITLTEKGKSTSPNTFVKGEFKSSRPAFATPINAELARAAERFRQMNERQAVDTPEGLKELFNPNAQGSGTTNKLFEQQVTPQQIRSEIRAAYDRAIQGSGSIQAPIQQVFDEARAQIPTLTEKQFGEQLQALYEDGSAFLVPADRSDTMMAAGERWGVYDASGMPASYVGVMPMEVKASRVPSDVEAYHRRLLQEKKVVGPQVDYGGRPIQDEKGNILDSTFQTEEGYERHAAVVQKIVADLIKQLPSPVDLPNELNSDSYLKAIGSERNIDLQQSLFVEAEHALRKLAEQSKDPEEAHSLIRASKEAQIYARQLRSGAGRALGRTGWQYKDSRYAGQFVVDGIEDAKAEEQAEAVDGKFDNSVDEKISSINDEANKDATEAMDSDVQAALEESQLEEGKRSLSEKARNLLNRIHAWIADIGAIRQARLKKNGDIKASNVAAQRQSKYASMTIEQLDAEEAKLSKQVESALEELADELFKTSKPKTGKPKITKDKARKTAEKLARPSKKEKLFTGGKMTQLQRLLDKTREGWTWAQIFTLPEAGQVRRRADMLQKVKENEAFADLTETEQAQLVELLDQAWYDRKATYFARILQRMGAKLPFASNKSVSLAVIQSVDKLLKHFNDGTFDRDAFREVLAEKFGIKPINQENLAKAKKLAQEMQEPGISDPLWVKKADELVKLVSSGQKLTLARIMSDWWITSVLSGPRTLFAIATAFTNGLGRIMAEGSQGVVLNGDVKTMGAALKRYFQLWPTAFKEMGAYIATGDKSILENSKEQLSGWMAEGLKGGNPLTTSYQLLHWNKDKHADATPWQKTQGNIMRTMGRFMTAVERILTALDHFNAATTKYGYLPLAIAQNKEIYNKARLPTEAEIQIYRDQAKADLFDGKEPQTAKERTLLENWTRHYSDKHYKEFQDILDGANYAGQIAAMTTNPEGFAGGAYRLILGAASKARDAADKLAREAELVKNDPESSRYEAWLGVTAAATAQLAAYSAQNLLGLRFVRYISNKFNDTLTYIPIAGVLLRAGEKTNKNKTKSAIILSNQAIGFTLGWIGWLAIKALTEEPDDEKRGWSINGPWQNISPEQKSQLMSSGEKAYSLTVYDSNGKKHVLSYQGWPISAILSAIGTMADMIKYQRDKWDEKDYGDRMFAATYIAATSVADTAALSQLSEILGKSTHSSDPIESGVKRFAKYGSNFAGGFVPRLFKDADSWFNAGINKYDGVYENFAKEVPWVRSSVGKPRLDIFGEQVQVSRAPWSREFPNQPTDPVYATLGKLNQRDLWLSPSDPSLRTVGMGNRRRHLNPEEQERYMAEVSKGYREVVEKYGNKILSMPGERASDFLAKKTKEVRDRAEKKSIRRLTTS